jgi:hypothetical protein
VQVKATVRTARCILVSCANPADRQFDGMRKAVAACAGAGAVEAREWDGAPLVLAGRRGLTALVLAGHGCGDQAALGDGRGCRLAPADVSLPVSAELFLLGCSQGCGDLRAAWARGSRLAEEKVHGAEGETETLLSTLFVLHLAREGPAGLAALFEQWVLANRLIRPFFEPCRELYRSTGGDPRAALSYLERRVDLGAVKGFLSIVDSCLEYLTGLLPVP